MTETDRGRRTELLTRAAHSHHTALVRYVYGMTMHMQDAENIVQDLWRHAFIYFPDFKISEPGFLFDKARKLVIDHFRAASRKPVIGAEELTEKYVAKQSRDAYTRAEELSLKASFFEQFPGLELKESQRNVLWLHARYGFTYKEISEQTGISVSTIGDWIALGRKKIAEHLNGGKTHAE